MFYNFFEIWKFRALLAALVSRHLNARYRGSFFGFLWSFLNPLCLLGVYALVFKYYIRFDSVENYTVFMFAGLLPWVWFSGGLLEATSSISAGGNLITKALFPPQLLPIVAVLTHLIHFVFAIPVLLVFMLASGIWPGVSMLALPVVILIEFVFMMGLSLLFAAINVHFRDAQHILGNVMTLWFFLCPIIYPVTNIPEQFKFTLVLNPLSVFTIMYQDIFLYNRFPGFFPLLLVASLALFSLILGNMVFSHFKESFAELV